LANVFISYAREDVEFVRRLRDAFTQTNREAWVDWSDIPATADWWKEILAAIEAAESFLFVISPAACQSKIANDEVQHAAANGKRLIPLLLTAVPPQSLPSAIARHQWVSFRDNGFEQAFAMLIAAVDKDLVWVQAHTRLLVRAKEWERKLNDDSFLLRGKDLEEAEQWLSRGSEQEPKPIPLQRDYIASGRRAATKRQRNQLIAVSIALAITVVLAVIAWKQRNVVQQETILAQNRQLEAEAATQRERLALKGEKEQHERAEQQLKLAQSRSLAIEAENAKAEPDTALLLSLHALRFQQTAQSESALLRNLLNYPRLERSFYAWRANSYRIADVLTFDAAGNALIAGYWDGAVVVWALQDKTSQPRYLRHPGRDISSGVSSLALRDDGRLLAAALTDGSIHLWTWPAGRDAGVLWSLPEEKRRPGQAPNGRSEALAFQPHTGLLAAGGFDGRITLWNTEQRKQLEPHFGDPISEAANAHQIGVQALVYSKDGSLLVSGHGDGMIRIWDATKRYALKRSILTHTDGVAGLSIDPYQKRIAWNGEGWSVAVLDIESDKPRIFTVAGGKPKEGAARTLAFSPDGQHLVSGHLDGQLLLWDVTTGNALYTQANAHLPYVGQVMFAPNGKIFASCGGDGIVRLWRVDGSVLERVLGDARVGQSLALNEAGSLLAIIVGDSLEWWNASTGQKLAMRSLGQGSGSALAFRGDREVAVVAQNGTLLKCTPDKCIPVRSSSSRGFANASMGPLGEFWIEWRDRPYRCSAAGCKPIAGESSQTPGAVSLDGQRWVTAAWVPSVASGIVTLCGNAITCRRLNLGSGGPSSWIGAMAFDHDGGRLVVGTGDGRVAFFNGKDGTPLGSAVTAHHGGVIAFAFQPQGNWLASGGRDGTVLLWDLREQEPIGAFPRPDLEQVQSLLFAKDGKRLLVQYTNGRIVWLDADLSSWQRQGCAEANRNFSIAEWQRFVGNSDCESTCDGLLKCPAWESRPPSPF
jgi:WD40 repeat protein